jgi:hypothetical protein
MAKIYIDNAKYMEFIDDIATQMTMIAYKDDMFEPHEEVLEGSQILTLTDDAQDFYNEKYDWAETILNNTLNIHSNEHFDRDSREV